MDLHVYVHFADAAALPAILTRLTAIDQGVSLMTTQLTALSVQVAESTRIDRSAVLLIQGIAQQLKDAQDDPAAIALLAASLHDSAGDLSAAIEANTAPAPVDPPVAA